MKRFLIYTDIKLNIFWKIEVNNSRVTVTCGKAGIKGGIEIKEFLNEEESLVEAEKLISEKLKEGYVDKEEGMIQFIERVEKNQILVEKSEEEDLRRVLNMLIDNLEYWENIIKENEGLEYGRLVEGEFVVYESEQGETSEDEFFKSAVLHQSLLPLVIQYIEKVDAAMQFDYDTRMGMSAVYQLAMVYDDYIPLFIEHHRKIYSGGGEKQMKHLVGLLSNSENGLRLLAASCVYEIDQPDIEFNLEYWIEDYVGEDEDKKEMLFKYIMEEAIKIKNKKFTLNYIREALDIMDVPYNEELLEKTVINSEINSLPTLSSIV